MPPQGHSQPWSHADVGNTTNPIPLHQHLNTKASCMQRLGMCQPGDSCMHVQPFSNDKWNQFGFFALRCFEHEKKCQWSAGEMFQFQPEWPPDVEDRRLRSHPWVGEMKFWRVGGWIKSGWGFRNGLWHLTFMTETWYAFDNAFLQLRFWAS